jgi:S1-C subfamily serine protease
MIMKHMGHRRVWAGALAVAALSGLLILTRAELPISLSKPELVMPALESAHDVRRDATVSAVEEVMPSVVNIATSRIVEYHDFYDQLRRQYFGLPPQRSPRTEEQLDSLGSGVIIHEDGYILTNLHVVRRGSRVQVKLADGRVYDADKIVDTSKSDVALLKLRAKPGEKFKAIQFAPDNDLLLGETVIALGNPFGLGGSVSRGILSSKNRRPATGNEPLNIADWLQTDAAINPGNSGGPLINLRGELIGINVAVYEQAQGISFAIPVREVSKALSQFFSPEIANSRWFGAWLQGGLTPPTIAEVQAGSPADKAGLKPGMQITHVNGQPTRSLVDFSERIVSGTESEAITLGIVDNNKRRNVSVKLEPFKDLLKRRTGLGLKELTSEEAAQLGLRSTEGLLIESIERGSPAASTELKPGMLVTAFDNTVVNELRDMGFALINKGASDSATLTIFALKRIGGPYVQPVQAKVSIALRQP